MNTIHQNTLQSPPSATKTMPLIDRLFQRVETVGHVCLGLDTHWQYLPSSFAQGFSNLGEAIFQFNKRIIDATLEIVACYKIQIAYYEALGLMGMKAYADTLGYLRDKGAITIADIKRGDIAKTAEMYADAHFSGDFEADFITINSLMGQETMLPFVEYVKKKDKGFFALVATSNPGAQDVEGLITQDGNSVSYHIGEQLKAVSQGTEGVCGYSPIGAVVGCTNTNQTQEIRRQLSSSYFLIPGYGAQGGTAQDMKEYFHNGNGGVVNSSRGILLAWQKNKNLSFEEAAYEECLRMREDIWNA